MLHRFPVTDGYRESPMAPSSSSLLSADETPPFVVTNPGGRSALVLVCEHGGRRLPKARGRLGLAPEDLVRHFAWDIGALELARALSDALDAVLVHQPYSRLLCDCNRRPGGTSFIPREGEGTRIPGNADLSEDERDLRTGSIWQPFHDGLSALLDRRLEAGRASHLVSIHSFTPVFFGEPRPWRVGVLHDRNRDLSPALYQVLTARLGRDVGLNQPYRMNGAEDYTIPVHGDDRGLASVEIEVRNDQLGDPAGVAEWSGLLSAALAEACERAGLPTSGS